MNSNTGPTEIATEIPIETPIEIATDVPAILQPDDPTMQGTETAIP